MFEELLERIAQGLRNAGIPYMVIGGQAVLLYGEPRLTKDIDVTLGADLSRLEDVLSAVHDMKIIPQVDPETFTRETMVLPCSDPGTGIRVDMIFSFSPYEQLAISRARTVQIGKTDVCFASLEDLLVHKLIAGRARDMEDARIVLLKNPIADLAYVRRWPQVLISWTRLLSGEWRDPLVARDAFVGCTLGALAYCGAGFVFSAPSWFDIGEPRLPGTFNLSTVSGGDFLVSAILGQVLDAVFVSLSLIALLFLLRILLRNQEAAIAASVLIMAIVDGGSNYWAFTLCLLIFYPIVFFTLMRFGLVSVAFLAFWGHLLVMFPVTFDTSAWCSGAGYATLALHAAIVLFSFRTSLGGRPLIAAPISTTDSIIADFP